MTELKLTVLEGLRTQDDVWEDFGTGEDAHKRQKEAEIPKEPERRSPDTEAEDEDDDAPDGSKVNQEETTVIIENNHHHHLTETVNEEKDSNQPDSEKRRSSKKSRAKKSKAHKNRQHSPAAGHSKSSHRPTREPSPQVIQRYDSYRQQQQDKTSSRQHGHSSQENDNRERGRKLNRRRQMKNEHLLEQVEKAGQERLEQKFQELEDLMTRPLVDTRGGRGGTGGGHRMSSQRVQRMVNLQHQHGQNGHPEQPEGENGREDRQAYSTIRVLQASGRQVQLKITYSPRAAHSHPDSRLPHKPSTPQHSSRGSVDSPTTSSSGRSHSRTEQKENGYDSYTSEESGRSDDDGSPGRAYEPTDTFLRRTDNPKLREWIRRKDAEYRKARKAERIKKREERNDKMVEDELKIARREKSSERVKQWMAVKRKEVLLRQKTERRRRKREEEEERRKRARSQESGLQGTRIDRPRTAPTQKSSYRLIKRPNSAAAKLDEGKGSNSKPPDTKFVYKRSVTGRVQLMKLQNERSARARSADEQRYDELSAEERQEKARTSYDAWLLAKKKEALENKKAARRQKEAMKSDPEMERIIPELARRRIDRVKNGKKTLDTGLQRRSTASSGGEEEETQEGESQETAGEPQPSADELTINGVAATMATADNRPASAARVRTPKPHKSSSPPRPKSATSAVRFSKKKKNAETPQASQSSQFKLPFPDELGVPYHVKQMQEKIFSKQLTSQSDDTQRLEPQGCAAVESAACPKGGRHKAKVESSPQTSLALLQEIEAEAMQSEQAAEERATLVVVQSVLQMAASSRKNDDDDASVAGEDQDAQETQESEQCMEGPGEEPAQPDVDIAEDEAEQDVEDKAEQDVEQEEQPEHVEDASENKEDATEDSELPAEEEPETGDAEKNEDETNEENVGNENGSEPQQDEEENAAAADDDDQPQEEEEPAEELEEEEEGEEQAQELLIDIGGNTEDFTEEAESDWNTEPSALTEEEMATGGGQEKEEEEKPAEPAAEEEASEEPAAEEEASAEPAEEEEEAEIGEEEEEEAEIAEEENVPAELAEEEAEIAEVEEEAEIAEEEEEAELAEEEEAETAEEEAPAQPDPSDDDPTTTPPAEDVEQDTQEAAAELDDNDDDDDSLRKLEKHVSFCEELATEYEPASVEASSSFEDEQEDKAKEAEQKTQ